MQVSRNLARAAAYLAAAAIGAGGCSRSAAPPLTVEEAAGYLTDETRLARLDTPSARLISSYDRTGGNDDFGNFVGPGPEGWAVLADLKGPGYVSRFWTTGEENGRHPVRFYFDGERSPRLETTLDDLCGVTTPLTPLAAYEPWCWYTFAPLLFDRRLVIMTRHQPRRPEAQMKLYYQVCAVPAEPGRRAETYGRESAERRERALAAARAALARGPSDAPGVGDVALTNRATAAAGGAAELLCAAGPALIRRLAVRPDVSGIASAAERERLMRALVLRIFWNDAAEPSVETPFGDFFGSVWRPRQYGAFYFGMSNGCYYARFPMPFERAARIEVRNDSAQPVPLTVECLLQPLAGWTNAWGYLHAGWRKSGPADVGKPHVILQTAGRGKYVGCLLTATSLDRSWWLLEGDESIRVDGEPTPGWRGTGLEDYFNAGWYYGRALARPFHGVPFKAHFRTVQYRIHQMDPVGFQRAVEVQMERGPNHASRGWFESVAFYYLAEPARADSALGDAAWRQPPEDPVAAATIMTELNDLEALGDYRGAVEWIDSFLERQPASPYEAVLRLRRLRYRAREEGFAAARAEAEAFAAATTNALARRQAEDWLWYESSSSNALLGVYCNMRSAVFLDGRYVGEGGDPQRLQVYRVTLTPGRHALAVKARDRPYPRWVQVCLQTHGGTFYTSPEWKFAYNPAGGWEAADGDDAAWHTVGGPELGKGPPEEPYVWLEPHAYVDMQARARGIWVTEGEFDASGMVVFRTAFETRF